MEPQRTTTTPQPCCCRLTTDTINDLCPNFTSGPDEPICEDCIASMHHVAPTFAPMIRRI